MKIEKAVKKLLPNYNIKMKRIITDSRIAKKNDLFIPLKGDNYDGHNFIDDVIKKGCSYVYCDKQFEGNAGYFVNDTFQFYCDVALIYRRLVAPLVIAITGSTGKTTTKSILWQILVDAKFNVHCTEKNENNIIGVPKTILSMDENTDILIIELGSNHFGEIEKETVTSEPDVCVCLNIGPSHLEFFGSIEGVFKEKSFLIDFVKEKNGNIFLPDDKVFRKYRNYKKAAFISDKSLSEIEIPKKLNYFTSNVRFALAVSEMLKIEKEVALKALNQFEPERMKVFEWRGKTIIDDAYNANPTSFNKSLEYLFSKRGRKALVIGRMLELGIYEKEYEKKLFEIIFKGKPSLVIAKGGFAESIPQNWIKMNDENEIYGYLERHIDSFDILLLKGSHKTEVYKIANLLRGGV